MQHLSMLLMFLLVADPSKVRSKSTHRKRVVCTPVLSRHPDFVRYAIGWVKFYWGIGYFVGIMVGCHQKTFCVKKMPF